MTGLLDNSQPATWSAKQKTTIYLDPYATQTDQKKPHFKGVKHSSDLLLTRLAP